MSQFAEGDKDFLWALANFVNLKPRHLAELTGRSLQVVYYRLRALGPDRTICYGPQKGSPEKALGYVNYLLEGTDKLSERETVFPQNKIERVHFLTQKGWNKALDLGFLKYPVNFTRNSNQNLDHDLKLSEIHLALYRRYGNKLHWFQYRPYIYVKGLVNADAFFWLDLDDHFPCFFVELENRRESGHEEDGDLTSKLRQFTEFAKAFEEPQFEDFSDFRVAIYRLTDRMAKEYAKKASSLGLAHRRFWITDIPSAIAGTESFITPKDYTDRRYSLDEA